MATHHSGKPTVVQRDLFNCDAFLAGSREYSVSDIHADQHGMITAARCERSQILAILGVFFVITSFISRSVASIECDEVRYVDTGSSLIRFCTVLAVSALFLGEPAVILLQWSTR